MDAYAPRLYGYFYRATRDHHEAEDLLGEMTLRLVKQLNKYDEQGRFEPWLFRIAANLVRDRIRRRKARPVTSSLSAGRQEGASLGDAIPAPAEHVEAGLIAEEQNRQLADALATLDDQTREMILLRHYGEMPFKDIAELYACPVGTALAKVHRGLKRLREVIGERHGTHT